MSAAQAAHRPRQAEAGRGLGPPWRPLALVEASGQRTMGGVLALARLSREKRPQPSSAHVHLASRCTTAAQVFIIGACIHHVCVSQVLQPLPETPLCSAIDNL